MSNRRRQEFSRRKRKPLLSISRMARSRQRSSSTLVLLGGALLLLAAVVVVVIVCRPEADVAYARVGQPGEDVRIPVGDVADGRAKFFEYSAADAKPIRFFVLRTADGVTRAAFDTCDLCFRERRGYRQSGDSMICNSCGKTFRTGSIGDVHGGCNPIRLPTTGQHDHIVITAAALELGTPYF